MRLKDKVVIVTGGGNGIGRAFCLGLADEGARVIAADISFEAAREVVLEIEARGKEALALHTDVSDGQSALEMAEKTVERFGRIDVLVNNAAMFIDLGKRKPWTDIDETEWDRTMAVNVKGPFLCARAVYPYMKAQGRGKIINICSGIVYHGTDGMLHYAASKGGVLSFTRSLARELAGQNITVNAISPGSTIHERVIAKGVITPDRIAWSKSVRCVPREMYPSDLVGTLLFLASDECEMICGQNIMVDGGYIFL